jgi:predicted dehydrogenase
MTLDEQKPITVGMVGGGPDSGIGETHRIAMRIDNKCALVAGVFSRRLEKSALLAKELGISPERFYGDYKPFLDPGPRSSASDYRENPTPTFPWPIPVGN